MLKNSKSKVLKKNSYRASHTSNMFTYIMQDDFKDCPFDPDFDETDRDLKPDWMKMAFHLNAYQSIQRRIREQTKSNEKNGKKSIGVNEQITGKTLVFKGVMKACTHAEASVMALAAGAKVLSSMSGNSNILVVGTLSNNDCVEEASSRNMVIWTDSRFLSICASLGISPPLFKGHDAGETIDLT